MLVELRISQFAIVEELIVPLGAGLTVITGETGAGKSVVAGALGLLCGRPVPKDLVREGEECAWVEGVFDLSGRPAQRADLARAGVRVGPDGMVVLRRELRVLGRSRVLINGLLSSLALLETIGPRLLMVQSQDQQRELTEPAFAREFLDDMADTAALREEVRAAWDEHRQADLQLAARQAEERAAGEQLELWRWQSRELDSARLRAGEEEEIAETLVVKRHAGALQAAAAAALARLEGGDSPAVDDLGAALAALKPVSARSQRVAAILAELAAAAEAAGGAATGLRRFLEGLDLDSAGLDELESRRALYHELQRKYGRDTPGLLELREDLEARIARQEAARQDLSALSARSEAARRRLEAGCAQLHRARRAAAPEVAARAAGRIAPLALGALQLEFAFGLRRAAAGPVTIDGETCDAGPEGADDVRLLVRTNRGERMGEVATLASGGERSRIHLGLTALRRGGPEPPLLLCDEIDAGLGSDAAPPVAMLLRELAAESQVVCITHLPTMAVHGDAHLRVAKTQRDGRTVLRVAVLAAQERAQEIARLLGGAEADADTAAARAAYAASLLAEAGRAPAPPSARARRFRG